MTDSKDIPIGERLASARKKKRLRYKKLSSELNIEESYLIALEEENYDYIPGGEAYVKGFLRSYSKKLNLRRLLKTMVILFIVISVVFSKDGHC